MTDNVPQVQLPKDTPEDQSSQTPAPLITNGKEMSSELTSGFILDSDKKNSQSEQIEGGTSRFGSPIKPKEAMPQPLYSDSDSEVIDALIGSKYSREMECPHCCARMIPRITRQYKNSVYKLFGFMFPCFSCDCCRSNEDRIITCARCNMRIIP